MSTTFTEIIEQTRGVATFPDVFEGNLDTERLLRKWVIELTEQGARQRKPQELMFAYHIFEEWKKERKLTRPVIVAAEPGFGKSTMLKTFLRDRVRSRDQYGRVIGQSETFGAIIVKQKLDDIEALSEYINADNFTTPLVKRNSYAYYIQGYNPEIMTRQDYEKQFVAQEHYNVVLMTMEQFRLQTIKENLYKFTHFTPEGSKWKVRRNLLIIDEKPKIVITDTLTVQDITRIMGDIRRVSGHAYTKDYELLKSLRDRLEAPDVSKGEAIKPESQEAKQFAFTHDLKNALYVNYDIDEITKLRALETLVNQGGTIEVVNGNAMYATTIKIAYDWTVHSTFIMDGTGRFDPDYIDDDGYTVLAPPLEHDGSNIVFNFCDDYLFSKGQLSSRGR